MNGETTMLTDRDECERAIEALSEAYPKTFVLTGKARKPLKIGIEDDIKAELLKSADNELRFYDIDDALEWYRSHVGYQLACAVPGATRFDLEGKAAGKITEAEAYQYEQDAK
jgi:ProP effector